MISHTARQRGLDGSNRRGVFGPNKLQHLGGLASAPPRVLFWQRIQGAGRASPSPNGCLFKALVSFKRSCSPFPASGSNQQQQQQLSFLKGGEASFCLLVRKAWELVSWTVGLRWLLSVFCHFKFVACSSRVAAVLTIFSLLSTLWSLLSTFACQGRIGLLWLCFWFWVLVGPFLCLWGHMFYLVIYGQSVSANQTAESQSIWYVYCIVCLVPPKGRRTRIAI